MLKEVQRILSLIPNTTYADVRIIDFSSRDIATKDGVVEALSEGTSLGYGIRILKNGSWGFASSSDMSPTGIDKTIKKTLEICEATTRNQKDIVELIEQAGIVGSYKTPIKKDPFAVSLDTISDVLLAADKAQRIHKNIKISQTFFTAQKEKKYFAASNGALIDQEIVWTGAGLEASAADDHDFQNRSYPNSFRGQNSTRGYELLEELDLASHAPRVAEEAVALLTAPLCPTETTDIILDGNQLALQIHESCGHATELDRVLGDEASYAGTSFLTPEKLGNFKYGSSIVNLTADATLPGGLGTFGFDDEGTPASRTFLVKDGIFNDYLTSRETVTRLKEFVPSYNRPSNGTVRASSWSRLPMIRMTNVNLEPGTWKLDKLIEDTKKGIFMSTNRSWSIDDRRLNFQFGTEIAWEIIDGKKGRMLKNPTYQGMTP
ncbi:MAG: TldD/PmbA family protein, partial [Patescibacteria group bacterium]